LNNCRLSVNINKAALLRNSRGANNPDVIQIAKDCERFGAEGITVHPRPDQRHIKNEDVYALKEIVQTEFNIEGKPTKAFIEMVCAVKPAQVTLVPDGDNQLTSDHGWNTIADKKFLQEVIAEFKRNKIRVSIFLDPNEDLVEHAADTGTDRIELYTGPFAHDFLSDKNSAILPYIKTAKLAHSIGLGINAGHDLDLRNLKYFDENISHLAEVSIGHALFCDAIYYGLENTIQMYQRCLKPV